MPAFKIDDKTVGDGAPVYFVAELSANHGHSLDKALKTVVAAAQAGADAIKLQTYTPDTLTLQSDAPPFVVQTKNLWEGRTLYDLYSEAMTPWEWHQPIMEAAQAHGLACFSTPFDPTAVHFLASLQVPVLKVASFELVDLPLIETMARQGMPMILSTGMASLADIEAAVNTCVAAGNRDLALMRCVSAYPAAPEAMDLRSLEVLRGFGTVLGLSDHTRTNVAALAAVSLGARLIEKHFIVDRAWGGPDAFFSLEPDEFKQLVSEVRSCEAALGRPRFGPAQGERASRAFRRSLFVARDVPAGSILTCDDIRSIRPSNGLAPRHLPEVLGRTALRDLKAAEPVDWHMVGPSTVASDMTIRAATLDDSDLLRLWRNDPETRASSRTTIELGAEEHVRWLKASLISDTRCLMIGVVDGQAVGQLRLDRCGASAAEISITIAPELRGRGLATRLLRAVEAPARDFGTTTLLAEIRPANQRSVRAFKRAGYYGFSLFTRDGGDFWTCERRLRRFPA